MPLNRVSSTAWNPYSQNTTNFQFGNATYPSALIFNKPATNATGLVFYTQESGSDILTTRDATGNTRLSISDIGVLAGNAINLNNVQLNSTPLLTITNNLSSTVPMWIRGAVGQTNNLQEWQNSAASIVARILSDGQAVFQTVYTPGISNGATGSNAYVGVPAGGTIISTAIQTNQALRIINTNASPTADLTQWRNPADTVTLASINPSGHFSLPKINFIGGTTTISALTLADGTVSFEGTAGQLFSVSNSLTGTIFSINDISGLPSVEVTDLGIVKLNELYGQTVVGSGTPATSAQLSAIARTSATIPLVVRGTSGQSANLQEWQNNTPTTVASISNTGAITAVDLTLSGNLTVNGTTTNINTVNLVVEDKNIVLGDVASPSTTTADGGGLTLLAGGSNKTFNWVNATDRWTSSVGLEGTSIVRTGGTSSQFLKADGSVDSSAYITAAQTFNLGTTSIALNRASAAQSLTGITSIDGSAATLTTSRNIGDVAFNGSASIVPERIYYKDTRATNYNPFTHIGATLHLKTNTTDSLADGGTYHGVLDLAHWTDSSGGVNHQLGLTDNGNMWIRYSTGASTWSSWSQFAALTSTTPSALGSAAVGTAGTAARADHVHPTTGLGLTSGTLAQFAATTSAQLAGVISDETGSGALVFATSPTLVTPSIGVATGTSFNSITGLSSTTPTMDGTAAVGTGTTVARADHVHASDTTRLRSDIAQQGGKTYVTHDFNTYPSLYDVTFVNPTGSTNLPTNMTAVMSYRFIMGAGDTTGRGFDLVGAAEGSGNLYIRERSIGTWSRVMHTNSTFNLGTTSITLGRASASQSLTGISIDGSAGSVAAANITGTTLASGVTASSLTSVGTLTSLTTSGALNLNYASPTIASNNASAASIFTSNVTGITIGSSSIRTTAFPADGTTSTAAASEGYMGMPQVAVSSGGRTLAASDAGKHIYMTTTSGQTLTIPANGTVAFPIGTTIVVVNGSGISTSIAITTDTLRLANSTSTGTRTLASNGMCTLLKINTTEWIASGNGLT